MDIIQQRNFTIQQRSSIQKAGLLFPRYLICVVVAFFVLIPIVVTVIGGFKTNGELLSSPFSLPRVWQLQNYNTALSQGNFLQTTANSTIVTLATICLLLLIGCPAAFVLARMPFRGREVIFNLLLFGLLFPIYMAILPLYITLRNLQLLNSLVGVILPQVAYSLPLSVLILRNFFRAIPRELEDATYIDGGSQIDFFWRVLIPLALPSLAVVTMLAMVNSWNNFILPLLVINSASLWTLPLGVMQFQGEYSTDWASTLAFLTLAMIPAIIFYLFAERYLVAGLTAGAIKG